MPLPLEPDNRPDSRRRCCHLQYQHGQRRARRAGEPLRGKDGNDRNLEEEQELEHPRRRHRRRLCQYEAFATLPQPLPKELHALHGLKSQGRMGLETRDVLQLHV